MERYLVAIQFIGLIVTPITSKRSIKLNGTVAILRERTYLYYRRYNLNND
jgi:hypothetical protein